MFSFLSLSKLKKIRENIDNLPCGGLQNFGKVTQVVGQLIEISIKDVPLGSLISIFDDKKSYYIQGEVVGFRKDKALVIPFCDPVGVCADALARCEEREQKINVGDFLAGRIIDAYGKPLDPTEPPLPNGVYWPISRPPLNPLSRKRISAPFDTGVRALNALLTFGEGQRVGIMSGSGVGKSVLMGMISRYSCADINVIALIGERGREVREFLEDNLGASGLEKSVVVVSTSDQSPLCRVRAAQVGTAIAEYFRDQGKRVLFLMDSLTRVAMAQREIGLAIGEPPTTKGYTPSVFSLLPRLLERAGNNKSTGSLTCIYTVLVEGDDFNDPVCDAARSILDGHINLSRQLAERNHFPAIDILSSASRVMLDIVEPQHAALASHLRDLLAEYKKNEDLITIGAYHAGMNPKLDLALKAIPKIENFLKQNRSVKSDIISSINEMSLILESPHGI